MCRHTLANMQCAIGMRLPSARAPLHGATSCRRSRASVRHGTCGVSMPARQAAPVGPSQPVQQSKREQSSQPRQLLTMPELFVTDPDDPWSGGELGIDFEIRGAPGKGLGVFALRDFAANEVVMSERPLMMASAQEAASAGFHCTGKQAEGLMSLAPDGASAGAKWSCNVFGCPDHKTKDGARGIFLAQSRVNHDCLPNCTRYYDGERDAQRMTAVRPIHAREELTTAYLWIGLKYQSPDQPVPDTQADRHAVLQKNYGFDCTCSACTDPRLARKIDTFEALAMSLLALLAHVDKGRQCRPAFIDQALSAGKQCVQLAEELQLGSHVLQVVHRDLFELAALRRVTHEDAVRYAEAAAEHAAREWGDGKLTREYRQWAERPQSYEKYGIADKWDGA